MTSTRTNDPLSVSMPTKWMARNFASPKWKQMVAKMLMQLGTAATFAVWMWIPGTCTSLTWSLNVSTFAREGISISKQCTWLSLIAMLSGRGNYCPAAAAAAAIAISNIGCLHNGAIAWKHVLETEISPSVHPAALSLLHHLFIKCFYFGHSMSGISDLLRELSHIRMAVSGFCGLETNHRSPHSHTGAIRVRIICIVEVKSGCFVQCLEYQNNYFGLAV